MVEAKYRAIMEENLLEAIKHLRLNFQQDNNTNETGPD